MPTEVIFQTELALQTPTRRGSKQSVELEEALDKKIKGCKRGDVWYERVTEGTGREVCMEFHRAPRRHVTEPIYEGILKRGKSIDKGKSIEHFGQLHLLCYDSKIGCK